LFARDPDTILAMTRHEQFRYYELLKIGQDVLKSSAERIRNLFKPIRD